MTDQDARDNWIGHQGRVWLVRRGAALVGFATVAGDELDGLYVLPQQSGRGIGSAPLYAVEAVRRLWVLEHNRAGRAWRERRGWRHTGRRQKAYGVWELWYER